MSKKKIIDVYDDYYEEEWLYLTPYDAAVYQRKVNEYYTRMAEMIEKMPSVKIGGKNFHE